VAIRPEDRAVVVGTADELFGHRLALEEVNWLAASLEPGDRCEIQVRYRARPVPARVSTDRAESNGGLALELGEPVRAITPGQSGVLYAGDRVLGGGVIS
jgi:tRNA-specific 2-thiouridylase